MTDDLLMAIRMLENIDTKSINHSFIYLFTNENIKGFLDKISFKNGKILTVCSSGDQAFNLVLNGSKNVDLFDINIFSKYYFYLKKAAIECLNYNEFINFFFPKVIKSNDVFNFEQYLNIRNYIKDDDIKWFWDYIFCHYSNRNIYNSNLFATLQNNKNNIIRANDYLVSENNYNQLKYLLNGSFFSFYHIDLFNTNIISNKKYDFIYLSNIFDYLTIENKLEYANKVKEIIINLSDNLSQTGMIAVSYLFLYFDDYDDKLNRLKSKEFKEAFLDSNYNYISFPGIFDINGNQYRNNDALMLYKKKN